MNSIFVVFSALAIGYVSSTGNQNKLSKEAVLNLIDSIRSSLNKNFCTDVGEKLKTLKEYNLNAEDKKREFSKDISNIIADHWLNNNPSQEEWATIIRDWNITSESLTEIKKNKMQPDLVKTILIKELDVKEEGIKQGKIDVAGCQCSALNCPCIEGPNKPCKCTTEADCTNKKCPCGSKSEAKPTTD